MCLQQHQQFQIEVKQGDSYPNTDLTTSSPHAATKKREVFSSVIRIWLWLFPNSLGLITASVWQSSLWAEISSLLSHHFGSDCRARNSFWHVRSWNEPSLAARGSLLLLPALIPNPARLLQEQVWGLWHLILPYTGSERVACMSPLRGQNVRSALGCSWHALCGGFLRTLGFWSIPS